MKGILLASSFFILATAVGNAQSNAFVSIAPKPENFAWWLRAEFHPFDRDVRGIPVGRIRTSWCKATEFRQDLFPPGLAADLDYSGGLSFAVDGFFDGSKTKQTALLGAYETCIGKKGSFLLILAWPQGKGLVIRFVHEMGISFGMLTAVGNTVTVFHCIECNDLTQFRWSKSKRRFVQLPFRAPS
jgi:hypothetical protein